MFKLLKKCIVIVSLLVSISFFAEELSDSNWESIQEEYTERSANGTWTLEEVNGYLAGIYHMSQAEFDRITTLITTNDKTGFENYIKDLIENIGATATNPGSMAIKQMDNVMQTLMFKKKKFRNATYDLKFSAQKWGYKNEKNEGVTYNFTPNFVAGEDLQLFLAIPMSITEEDDIKEDVYSGGFDVGLKYNFTDYFGAGLHLNAIYINNKNSLLEDSGSVAGGAFLSGNIDISESVNISAGAMVDAVIDVSSVIVGKESYVGAGGINIGIAVTDNFIINPYGIYYQNIDSGSDFYTPGIDFDFLIGEDFTLTIGAKTVLETENDYEQDEAYFQAIWSFK